MADTNFIKKAIEPAVRDKLERLFRQPFECRFLPVGKKPDGSRRMHEFDAVSADGKIVVGIKSSTGITSGGRRPSGKIAVAYKEMYFLSRAKAKRKILALTDPEFYRILKSEFTGILPPRTEIIHVRLPKRLQKKMDAMKGRTD